MTGSVVFFDVAGTLIRVRDGVGAQYARVAGRFGVAADPKALEREFPRAFRAAPLMAFPGAPAESVPRLEREVWRGIVRDVFAGAGHLAGFAAGGFDAYFDAVYRHFEDRGDVGRLPGRGAGACPPCARSDAPWASSATSTAASCGFSKDWASRPGSSR